MLGAGRRGPPAALEHVLHVVGALLVEAAEADVPLARYIIYIYIYIHTYIHVYIYIYI